MIKIWNQDCPELYITRMKIKFYEMLYGGNIVIRPIKKHVNMLVRGFYADEGIGVDSFQPHLELLEVLLIEAQAFYSLLFNSIVCPKFNPLKTKKEKCLWNEWKRIKTTNAKQELTILNELANSINERFLKINPIKGKREFYQLEYCTRAIWGQIQNKMANLIIQDQQELYVMSHAFDDMTKKKLENLKRNKLKDGGLDLYKEIIKEIVRVESIGHKANIQSICTKIASEKNLKTDLRKAFDGWKKRNPTLYKKLYNEILSKYERDESLF